MIQSTFPVQAVPEPNPSLSTRFSRSERFAFILAMIGLLADTIGIGTFVFGLFSVQAIKTNSQADNVIQVLLAITSGAILVYGWFALAWFFTYRFVKMRIKTNPVNLHLLFVDLISRAALTAGFIALPGLLMWGYVVSETIATGYGILGIVLVICATLLLHFSIRGIIFLAMPIIYQEMNPYFEKLSKKVTANIEEEKRKAQAKIDHDEWMQEFKLKNRGLR